MRGTRRCRTLRSGTAFFVSAGYRSTDPNAHVAVAAGIPLPAAIVAVIVAVDGAAGEGKATKTAVEACAMKLAAMEGERTRRAVPSHRESTATESATAESPTHGVRAHPTMRAHATVSAAVSTTVSAATVSAAATRRRNGWSMGD